MSLSMIDTKLVSRWRASPNFEPRPNGRRPDMLILHYTGMTSHDDALRVLTAPDSKVSCHYLVDVDGRITQMVAERHRAWHAGVSSWAGETDINGCSVGIEIHNPGHAISDLLPFPSRQMEAVALLSLDICARWGIRAPRVLGHSDVAPGRKSDPGERFDWARLYRAGVGIWVPPAPPGDDEPLDEGAEGPEVARLQRALHAFGYGVALSGCYDAATKEIVTAFQRHWRPQRVDGRADSSTIETLRRVQASADLTAL